MTSLALAMRLGMRILVKISGHQRYNEYEGEALAYGQTIERLDGSVMQVPCVTLDTGSKIIVLPLDSARLTIEVIKLDRPIR